LLLEKYVKDSSQVSFLTNPLMGLFLEAKRKVDF